MYAGAMLSLVLLFLVYLPDLLMLTYVVSYAFRSYQTSRNVLPTLYMIVSDSRVV